MNNNRHLWYSFFLNNMMHIFSSNVVFEYYHKTWHHFNLAHPFRYLNRKLLDEAFTCIFQNRNLLSLYLTSISKRYKVKHLGILLILTLIPRQLLFYFYCLLHQSFMNILKTNPSIQVYFVIFMLWISLWRN